MHHGAQGYYGSPQLLEPCYDTAAATQDYEYLLDSGDFRPATVYSCDHIDDHLIMGTQHPSAKLFHDLAHIQ